MKKIAIFLLCAFGCNAAVIAQDSASRIHRLSITAGYGGMNTYTPKMRRAMLYSNEKYYQPTLIKTWGTGPMVLKLDYALTKKISIGLSACYSTLSCKGVRSYLVGTIHNTPWGWVEYYDDYEDVTLIRSQNISAGLRFNYHFFSSANFDSYIGLAAGYNDFRYKVTFSHGYPQYYSPQPHFDLKQLPVYIASTIGFRYYFLKHFGIYAELGFEQYAIAQAGLAFKL